MIDSYHHHHHHYPEHPFVPDFYDVKVPVFSTIGKGPRGEKGEKGEKGEHGSKGDPGETVYLTFAEPIEWNIETSYPRYTIVAYNEETYISRTDVPANIDITNKQYWQKISDFNNMLEQYQNEMEKQIDKASKIEWLNSDIKFTCVERFMMADSINNTAPFYGRPAAQCSSIVEKNGNKYWYCFTGPDNNNHIVITDMTTHMVVNDVVLALGHMNGCQYDGNNTIVISNDATDKVIYLDVSNPISPTIRKTVDNAAPFISKCAFYYHGKVCLSQGTGNGDSAYRYTSAYVYDDEDLTSLNRIINFNGFDYSDFGGWQSITCDDEFIYISTSNPETVTVLDMNGNLVTTINLRQEYDGILFDEVESFFIQDGIAYLTQYEGTNCTHRYGHSNSETVLVASSLFMCEVGKHMISPNSVTTNSASCNLVDPVSMFTSDFSQYHKIITGKEPKYAFFVDDALMRNHVIQIKFPENMTYPFPIKIDPTKLITLTNQFNATFKHLLINGRTAGFWLGGINTSFRILFGSNSHVDRYIRSGGQDIALTLVDGYFILESLENFETDSGTSEAIQINRCNAILVGTTSFSMYIVNSITNQS